MKQEKILKFPKDFLWGVSTSAYQIEGGIRNDWSEWEKSEIRSKKLKVKGKNPNDFICGRACDSYNRYEEDLDLVKDLGCGAYRMGIEWARIEPEEGKFNMEEIEHYRQVLQEAKRRDLKIVLTLWHWTNPTWLVNQGGWANKKTIDYYLRYAELIVQELGEYVDFWITLNEPMVPLANGYLTGKFPPNKKLNIFQAIKTFTNLIQAHKKVYDSIHKTLPKAQVSITKIINSFEPARKWFLVETFFSWLANYCANDLFLQRIKSKIDFIGFDYYFHSRVIWYPPFKKNINKKVTDIGWEIYPEGIYQILKNLNKYNKPIYVMENGLADAEDKERLDFIANHLKYIHQAIKEGVDVKSYFYWSLLDNFEWAEGWAPKFGLYEVDRKSFKRTPRPSVKVYKDICKNNRIKITN